MVWIILVVLTLTFAFLKYPYIDENSNITEQWFLKSPRFPELIAYGFFGLTIINVVFFGNPFSINGTILYLSCVVVSFNIYKYISKLLLTKTKTNNLHQ